MATINHKKYDEATETFKDFNVYDGKETLIFKVDGEGGNVGIGTASPAAKVEIFGSGNTLRLDSAANGSKEILFRNVGSGTATIKTDGDLKLYVEDAGKDILFDTTGGEKMRITSAGLVGIGTSSPTTSLDVIGSGRFKSSFGDYLLTIENIKDDSQGLLVRASDNDSTPLVKFQSSVGATSETWIDRFVVNKDGNVGIGTSSPNYSLQVNSSTTTTRLQITNSTTGTGATAGLQIIQDGNNTTFSQKPNGFMSFETNNTERMRIDSTGNVTLQTVNAQLRFQNTLGPAPFIANAGTNNQDLYVSTGGSERVRILSGGGITFNGDTAAANALDDYEEGTFTPTYAGGLTGVTYSTRYGSYTKIGNRVMFDLRIQATSVAGTSGSLVIGGLPFATNGAVISNATIGYFGVYTTDIVYCLIDTSAVDAILFYQKDATPLLGSELTADTSAIHLSGVYFV